MQGRLAELVAIAEDTGLWDPSSNILAALEGDDSLIKRAFCFLGERFSNASMNGNEAIWIGIWIATMETMYDGFLPYDRS